MTSSQATKTKETEAGVLSFKKLDARAVLPARGSALAAGLDLCSIEDLTIEPKQRLLARSEERRVGKECRL